jgi:hypothetical protein
MMAVIRTKPVLKDSYKVFLRKAEEFLGAAKYSLSKGNANVAAGCAAHAVISALDALAAFYLQRKHAGKDTRTRRTSLRRRESRSLRAGGKRRASSGALSEAGAWRSTSRGRSSGGKQRSRSRLLRDFSGG